MKRKSLLLIPLVIACGVFLFAAWQLFRAYRSAPAAQDLPDAAAVARTVEEALPQRFPGVLEDRSDDAMPALSVDGLDVIALLELPEKGVKLPVGDLQSDPGLLYRPARYSGTVYDGSLTIAGVSDPGQLDMMAALAGGEHLNLTDMTGELFTFTVQRVRRVTQLDNDTLASFGADLIWFAEDSGVWFVVCCVMG